MDEKRYKKRVNRLMAMMRINAPAEVVAYHCIELCNVVYGDASATVAKIEQMQEDDFIFCFGCLAEFKKIDNQRYCDNCKTAMLNLVRDIQGDLKK